MSDKEKEQEQTAEDSQAPQAEEQKEPKQSSELKQESAETAAPQESAEQEAQPEAPKKEESTQQAATAESSEKDDQTETASEEATKEAVADLSDEELESEDKHEDAVESDEDEDHAHPDELELPDYAEYSPEELVKTAQKLLAEHPAQKLKDHFEAIRKYLMKQLNEERDEKREQFIAGGGNELDFELIQPLREEFRKIFSQYRQQRKRYYDELRSKLEHNLKVKEALLEQLKEIVNKEESIGATFKEFNAIIQEWRNTGPVPRSASRDLWRNYHHHVENFYEYIKINKELRDLDYKKNREAKETLLEKAEALSLEKDVPAAFKALQELHKQWKHIGPVEPENREPMWEKFSAFTKTIHDKREAHFSALREKRGELIEEKKKLIEQIKAVPTDLNKHHLWQKAIKEVRTLGDAFKKIGRLNHPDNDLVWEQYREATRTFNRAKNDFYKNLKKDHQENLQKKRALVEKAEAMKDSDDWRWATNEFKRIQAEWKKIGHVPKKESDKIWKQFRAACNHYFERLTAKNKEKDQALMGNFEAKEKVLKELQALKTDPKDRKGSVEAIKKMIGAWRSIGAVPRAKQKIDKQFNAALDEKFAAVDLDRKESERIRFENRMEHLADQGGDQDLKRERRNISQQIAEARKEMAQLENNMSFFSSSDPNSPIVKEAHKKIEKQEAAIKALEQKKRLLNIKIHELSQDSAAEDSNEEDTAENKSE